MSSFCCQNKATNITTTSLTMRYNFAHPRKNFENNFENNFISGLLIAITLGFIHLLPPKNCWNVTSVYLGPTS